VHLVSYESLSSKTCATTQGPKMMNNDRKANCTFCSCNAASLDQPNPSLGLGLADFCLLCLGASGIQTCALFILPLAPRPHTFKHMDRWGDIAVLIVTSLLQNTPENHIFPSLPSGILNTQHQVAFSILH
jgi:hypothetical protein